MSDQSPEQVEYVVDGEWLMLAGRNGYRRPLLKARPRDEEGAAMLQRVLALLRLPRVESPPALVSYMTAETSEERDAAFLRTYAARVLDRTASSWEIPNTIATTLQDIANRIEARQQGS